MKYRKNQATPQPQLETTTSLYLWWILVSLVIISHRQICSTDIANRKTGEHFETFIFISVKFSLQEALILIFVFDRLFSLAINQENIVFNIYQMNQVHNNSFLLCLYIEHKLKRYKIIIMWDQRRKYLLCEMCSFSGKRNNASNGIYRERQFHFRSINHNVLLLKQILKLRNYYSKITTN